LAENCSVKSNVADADRYVAPQTGNKQKFREWSCRRYVRSIGGRVNLLEDVLESAAKYWPAGRLWG